MCKCAYCGKEVNPSIGEGIITPISHTPFCNKACYQHWCEDQVQLQLLDETEVGGNYDATGGYK